MEDFLGGSSVRPANARPANARNTPLSKTREFAGKFAHPRPEKTQSLPNEFERGAKLLCHRPVIGLCVESSGKRS